MNSFHNRQIELDSLEQSFASDGATFYVLYGRRRLGKTTLLHHFAAGKPGVYHMADRSIEVDAIARLAMSMAHAWSEPTFATPQYRSFDDLFTAYDRLRPPHKSFLILDEYQYLCEVQPALSSVLQRHWDESWSRSQVMLVLCGSVISMMYRETLARPSPLYGRRTAQWLLRPMRFRDMVAFFPGRSPRETIRMWSVAGGVPRYAEIVATHPDFSSALRAAVLARDGPLYAEARLLLHDEVSTPNVYASVLSAIASGANRISEIAGRLALPANQLTRYLAALVDMGLVRREVPVTEPRAEKSRRGLYRIADLYLRLWFGCVAPYVSLLEFGEIARVEQLMRERLTRHLAEAFEGCCRQHVEERLGTIGAVRVGRYWDRHHELDVVAVDESGTVVLAGECKWTRGLAGLADGETLQRKVEGLWPDRQGKIRLALFSSGGFSPRLHEWATRNDAWLVSAQDLVS